MMRRIEAVLISLVLCGVMGLAAGCSKESRRASHIRSGDKYLKANQHQKAEIEYLNALRLDPKDAALLERLGTIYFEQGRFERAFPILAMANNLRPDSTNAAVMLASLYTVVGQPAKVRETLLPFLSRHPGHADATELYAETALTPAERKETQEQVQAWRQKTGDNASFHVALGVLASRGGDTNLAEAEFRRALEMDPKLPTAHAAMGMVYWTRNDLTNAQRALERAVELSPPRSSRRMLIVSFLQKTGKAAEAKKLLEEMVKATPDYLPGWNRLAELQLGAKDYDACASSLERARALEPGDYDSGMLWARLRFAQGKMPEAIQDFERLRTKNPKNAELHYQLALAHLVNNDPGKAMSSLQESVTLNTNLYEPAMLLADLKTREGDVAGAILILSDIIKRRPNDEQAYYLLANAHRARGSLDEALAVYRGLVRAFPKNPRASLLAGEILRQQNKPMEARKAFEDALKASPDYSAAIAQLVELDLLEKNHAGALQRVQAAIERNPKAAGMRYLEAKVYQAKGDLAQAEASLRQTLELAPDFREAYVSLAQIFIASKKPDLALEELGKALAKNPKDTGTLLMMGMLYETKAEYAKARDTYEKLLAINPQFSPALNNLAYNYAVRFKQPDKGFELAQKARKLLPNDPSTADTLGWITYLRGDYAGALPLLQESAKKLPGEPEVQYHLGMAHYMMGHEGPARSALQLAVQTTNNFIGKDEARQKLVVLGGDAGGSATEAVQSLEKSLPQNPNDVALMLRLGALYEQLGQFDKAQDIAEKALKVNPKAVRAMLLLARIHGRRPDGAQRALDYAKSARAAAPGDGEVVHAAGRAAFQAGQHDWAYSILQESSRLSPGSPEVLFDLAWSAYSVGRVSDAEAAMQSALRTGTNFSNADKAKRFLEFVALSRNPAAIPQATPRIQEALKADPSYVPALMVTALAWEQRAGYAEARKAYDQILARYPKFLPASRNLAVIYANHLNDPQKGYELASRARQDLPGDIELAKALGKLAYQRGENQYAAQLLREVQQKQPADGETWFYLGMSQYRLKQKADSTNSLRQALALNLDAKSAEEARRVLAEQK